MKMQSRNASWKRSAFSKMLHTTTLFIVLVSCCQVSEANMMDTINKVKGIVEKIMSIPGVGSMLGIRSVDSDEPAEDPEEVALEIQNIPDDMLEQMKMFAETVIAGKGGDPMITLGELTVGNKKIMSMDEADEYESDDESYDESEYIADESGMDAKGCVCVTSPCPCR